MKESLQVSCFWIDVDDVIILRENKVGKTPPIQCEVSRLSDTDLDLIQKALKIISPQEYLLLEYHT